jgi:hypothetical protein
VGMESVRYIAIGMIGVLLFAAGVGAADGGKSAELQQALDDIRRVEQVVRARMGLAESVRGRLKQESEVLKAEIRDEQRRHGLGQYAAAVQVKRIDYDLRLLQRLAGYTEQLEGRLAEFQTILTCFERYRERIRDEMRIVRTLKDGDIGDLLRQIAATAEEVGTRCAAPLVTVPAAQRPLESIWVQAVQGR